jgi:hypothetical protein
MTTNHTPAQVEALNACLEVIDAASGIIGRALAHLPADASLSTVYLCMVAAYPNGLPIQQGTFNEERDWNTALRQARAALNLEPLPAFHGANVKKV